MNSDSSTDHVCQFGNSSRRAVVHVMRAPLFPPGAASLSSPTPSLKGGGEGRHSSPPPPAALVTFFLPARLFPSSFFLSRRRTLTLCLFRRGGENSRFSIRWRASGETLYFFFGCLLECCAYRRIIGLNIILIIVKMWKALSSNFKDFVSQ
jgi:hypothetical protein